LDIPSFGKATSNLHINVLAYAEYKPHTIFVLLNAKVPDEKFVTSTSSSEVANEDVAFSPPSLVPVSLQDENILEYSSFLIRIETPLTFEEHFRNFWSNFGEFITFAGGIVTGTIIPRLFKQKT
jgi:hypothetical protein